jgi:hypothetical protein
MFERFTEQAIKVIMLAQEEARRLGHNFIGTEQILLGLISEGKGIAATVLKSQNINLQDTRIKVETIIGRGSGFVQIEVPFTTRGKKVLELALKEARHLGHNSISTEHLLLGLITESDGVAVRVLQEFAVDIAQLRNLVLLAMGEKPTIRVDGNINPILLLASANIEQKIERLTVIITEAKTLISEIETWLQYKAAVSVDEIANLINNLPDSPPENQQGIKELLTQLLAAINADSELESEERKDALEQVMVLLAAWQNRTDKRMQKTAKTALKILKATVAELPPNNKLVADGEQILPAIAEIFALPFGEVDNFSPFAKALINSGYVNTEQMRQAIIESRKTGKPLTEVLQSLTGSQLSADLLSQYKQHQLWELKILYGVEVFNPETSEIPLSQIRQLITSIIPLDICQRYNLLPLSQHDSQPPSILVAMVNPDNREAHDELARILQPHGLCLQPMAIAPADYQQLIQQVSIS